MSATILAAPVLALVAAVARNGVIGRNNTLPWRLPSDLKTFKRLTMGKPIIMGRATFQSIGRPLPGRPNIVITGSPAVRAALVAQGVHGADTLDNAIALAGTLAAAMGCEEIMVIGGARVYAEALPRARRIYLTRVEAEPEGDAHFPAFCATDWQEISATPIPRSQDDDHDCTLIVLERCAVSPVVADRLV